MMQKKTLLAVSLLTIACVAVKNAWQKKRVNDKADLASQNRLFLPENAQA
jgi:hypothetical protein